MRSFSASLVPMTSHMRRQSSTWRRPCAVRPSLAAEPPPGGSSRRRRLSQGDGSAPSGAHLCGGGSSVRALTVRPDLFYSILCASPVRGRCYCRQANKGEAGMEYEVVIELMLPDETAGTWDHLAKGATLSFVPTPGMTLNLDPASFVVKDVYFYLDQKRIELACALESSQRQKAKEISAALQKAGWELINTYPMERAWKLPE